MQLLFDIGGTKSRLVVSRDGSALEQPRVIPTPQDFSVAVASFSKIAKEMAGGARFQEIAGGVPGSLNREKTMLVRAPHLQNWVGKPLREELSKALGSDVVLENDAALCGLGEALKGAGRGMAIVAYLTVSTGVGGVRIVDGKIDRNTSGFEPGHQIIDVGGKACESCNVGEVGSVGHLEQYVSGTNTQIRFGQSPGEIVNPAVWDELARFLAYGLNNTILHWSPDIVVLGGSMIVKQNGIKVAKVAEHLKNILTIFPVLPEIRQAELGDLGGLWGALALLRQSKAR